MKASNYNIIKWVEKVIQSCKTHEQLESAYRLIRNYEILYGNYHFLDLTLSRQWIKIFQDNGKA